MIMVAFLLSYVRYVILSVMKKKNKILGKKLLVITAHPDDESYLAAGTIFRNYQMGGTNFLVCATYGEKGKSHIKKPITQKSLKFIRKRELQKVKKILHISEVLGLNLPDGNLTQHADKMYFRSLMFAKKIKPEVILGFGSDGITGHYDHKSAGRVARKVAKQLKLPYFAFCLPPKVTSQALDWLIKKRSVKHYSSSISFDEPIFRIKINTSIKKRALRCHVSQLENNNIFTGYPDFAVKALLEAEYFRV